jgi:hypothetical protein
MKKILLIALMIIAMASVASARPTLKWSAVEDTPTCKIEGYVVRYSAGGEMHTKDVGNVLELDLAGFGIKTGDQFAVAAYSTRKDRGPFSEPVAYDGKDIPGKVIVIKISLEEE